MTAQDGFIDDHGTHALAQLVAGDVFPCATCDEHPARPGKLRCQACLDAEWARLHERDPAWYERHKEYHRQR